MAKKNDFSYHKYIIMWDIRHQKPMITQTIISDNASGELTKLKHDNIDQEIKRGLRCFVLMKQSIYHIDTKPIYTLSVRT